MALLKAYTSSDQNWFLISKVASHWYELMIPQRTMRPSVGPVSGLQLADIPLPQSATLGLHSVHRKLLFISCLAVSMRLS